MSFPLSPINGQTATLNGIVYSYSTSTQAWTRVSASTLTYTSINLSSTTTSTSTNSGALIVGGGVGIGGNLYVGGTSTFSGNLLPSIDSTYNLGSSSTQWRSLYVSTNTIYIGGTAVSVVNGNLQVGGAPLIASSTGTTSTFVVSNTSNSTSTTTGAIVVAGGIGVGGNITVGGAITSFGDATGNGALFAGTAGYTPFTQTIGQFTGNLNGYMEINVQNINSGTQASTDIVASSNNVGTNNGYIDMGITNGNWNGTQPYSLGTTLAPNDGYILVGPNASNNTGNLVFGTTTSGTNIKFVVAATNAQSTLTQVTTASVVMIVNPVNTPSTSTTTGALTVAGGVGIGGNITVGGTVTGGGVRTTSTSTPPVNPTVGDIWYNTTTDDIYRYTTDGTTSAWIDITGPGGLGQSPTRNMIILTNSSTSVLVAASQGYVNVLNYGGTTINIPIY